MARVCTVVVMALVLLASGRAHAWANAQVVRANADVTVRGDATARVELTLDVKVLGGWLTDVEVAGLDPGLVLDSSRPPTFVSATGEPATFTATADATGRVVFQFRRGSSPRVGNYTATIAYDAQLAEPRALGSRVRMAWTFPGWAAGLDDVLLRFHVPRAAAMVASEESGVTSTSRVEGDVAVHELRRLHLPRSLAWTVEFDFPRTGVAAAVLPPLPAATAPLVSPTRLARDDAGRRGMRDVVIAFACLAVLKRWSFDRLARSRGARARPLVPGPVWLACALVLVACFTAAEVWLRLPEVAFACLCCVVLLVAQRPAVRERTSRLGSWTHVVAADRAGARWDALVSALSPTALSDATRPLGFLVTMGTVAFLGYRHAHGPMAPVDSAFTVPQALVLFAAMSFVGGHRLVPRSVAERLLALESVARDLRVPDEHGRGFAFRLSLHRDANGVPQDARLRLSSEHRAAGLVRLDVALVERATLGGYVARPQVLCVARQGSTADLTLAKFAPSPSVRTAPGGRRARILPLHPAVFTLLDRLALPELKSVSARPLREIPVLPSANELYGTA